MWVTWGKITFFWVTLTEFRKVHYFSEATILSSPSHIISLKSTNFSKHEIHGKRILISSRGKFA